MVSRQSTSCDVFVNCWWPPEALVNMSWLCNASSLCFLALNGHVERFMSSCCFHSFRAWAHSHHRPHGNRSNPYLGVPWLMCVCVCGCMWLIGLMPHDQAHFAGLELKCISLIKLFHLLHVLQEAWPTYTFFSLSMHLGSGWRCPRNTTFFFPPTQPPSSRKVDLYPTPTHAPLLNSHSPQMNKPMSNRMQTNWIQVNI